MAVVYSNNASTALSSGITNSATSITVGSVADFPTLTGSDYYYATLANVTNTKIEIVKVTAAAGTTLTVLRGQDNTTAVSFDASDNLQLRVTAATLEAATRTDVAITSGSVSTSTITDATASAKGLATAAQITKLDAIEASADVTDTTNVTAAGALMDSEVTNLAQVKAFDTTDYATAAQGTTADAALPKAGGAMTGAITTNSTFDGRDVATDGSKLDGIESGATADQTNAEIKTAYEANADTNEFSDAEKTKLAGIATAATANGTVTGSGTTSGTNTGDNTVCTSGTATTAETLATARTIAGVSFDGSANISLNNNAITNGAGYTTNVGDITGVTAGTGMSGGGTSGTVTLTCTIDSPSEVGLGNLSSSGNALAGSFTATGNITAYSDLRLKTEIETIDSALEKVSDIRGVNFTMNGERSTGVIAQELELVLPEAVRDNEDGMKSVAYGNITGLLIEAIKELSVKVEELENK